MRSLVTGATGFLGSRLAEILIADGEAVRLFVRDRGRLCAGLATHNDIVAGDLSDPAVLRRAVEGVDVIFHCAANVKTWDAPEAYRAANVDGVRNLLDAVRTHCSSLKRLVHVSTVDVYGFPDDPCSEDGPLNGAGFGYGETKLAGEQIVREFGELHGIPFTILRPANIMGPRSPFISGIGGRLRRGAMLKIDGGAANAGVTDIDNLVAYLHWAASAPVARGETYNVRDDYDVSWSEVLRQLRARLDGRGIVVNLPFPVADGIARLLEGVHRRFCPTREPTLHRQLVRMFGRTCGHPADKIRAHSGISPAIGFDECMARSAAWLLAGQASERSD